VRADLIDPVLLRFIPANFGHYPTIFAKDTLETYRTDISQGTGVTVMERAVPVRNGPNWSRDSAAGTTARSVAAWLAQRPFLRPTSAVPVFVGGHHAWRVRTVLRAGATLHASANDSPVAPLFITRSGSRASVSSQLPGEVTVMRSPSGHGVIIIWSWTLTGRTNVLTGNRAMVAGLRFP
jgi:hypothetical protein